MENLPQIPQLHDGKIIKFGNDLPGWEYYITGSPERRERNTNLWMETGRRLGIDV